MKINWLLKTNSTPFGKPNKNHSHRKTSSPLTPAPGKTGEGYVECKEHERRAKMNNRGNVMLSLLFFIMALGVLVVFISPMNAFIDIMQQSDSLNCKGFIFGGDTNHTLSYNSSMDGGNSGDPLACLSLKLYLPYILLVFLVAGVASVLSGKAGDWLGMGGGADEQF